MKVVFVENISGVAMAGDIKEVKDGYARNLLIPKSLAFPATEKIIKETEELRKKSEAFREEQKQKAQDIKSKIGGAVLTFTVKADGDTLYAAITEKDISKKLSEEFSAEVDPKKIKHGHLKNVGIHTVDLILAESFVLHLQVKILAEGQELEVKKKEKKEELVIEENPEATKSSEAEEKSE